MKESLREKKRRKKKERKKERKRERERENINESKKCGQFCWAKKLVPKHQGYNYVSMMMHEEQLTSSFDGFCHFPWSPGVNPIKLI